MTDSATRGYSIMLYQEPEQKAWVAEVSQLPGCIAAGMTTTEAVDQIGEAIDSWIEAANATGRAVPRPLIPDDEYSGRFVLRIAPSIHRVAAEQAEREGVSLNQFCANAISYSLGVVQGRRESVPVAWSEPTLTVYPLVPGSAPFRIYGGHGQFTEKSGGVSVNRLGTASSRANTGLTTIQTR